ncbi:MAG: response regulator transcription factor [SAR202 cluster bacterium]|nr:response regulator transcription factor [SAR202 cluster bacterium]
MARMLRVLAVADDPLARAGLAALLLQSNQVDIAGQTPAHPELRGDVATYRPDVILWDIGPEPARPLELLAELADVSPPVVALVFDADHAANAHAAGARGVLFRDASPAMLVAALAAVVEGLRVYAGAPPPPDGHPPGERTSPPVSPLTPRELEVLGLVATGLTNKAIAQQLNISEHTVKFHVNSLLAKLGASSRTDAVVRASRLGLVFL